MTMDMKPKDAGEEYWIKRQEVSRDDLIARNQERLRALDAEQPQGDGTKPVKMELNPLYAPPSVEVGKPSMIGKVARDVGAGAIEAPRQIVSGISDAVREGAEAFNSLGNWLEDKIGGRVPVPLTGIKELDQLIENPLEAIAGGKDRKKPAAPETTTGHLVRETTRFLTSFLPLMKAGQAAGMGKVASAAVAGGVTEGLTKDPSEANLADLVKKFPALQTPVTDLLTSNPNDSEVVARAKKAFEGAGMGALAEGLSLAVRTVAAARRAKTTIPDAAQQIEAAKAEFGQVSDRDFLALGAPGGRGVEVRAPSAEGPSRASVAATKVARSDAATVPGVPDDIAAKGLTKAGDVGGKEVYVNFATIDGPDSLKKVIGQMADAFKGDVVEATRGVQTNKETKRLANRLNMTVEDLLNRRKGEGFNAEQAVAARSLLNASAEKLLSLAERAASPNAGTVDQFMFRRMMALHHAIQAEVIGARTETARALQSWSIPVNGGGIEKAKAVQEMLDQMGGAATSQAMAKRLGILAKEGDQAAVDRFVGKTWGSASMDVIREAWVNALLSSPKTHIVNMTSNAALQINTSIERAIAGKISRNGGSGEIVDGEAMALLFGQVNSMRDAFRLAGKSFREGNPVDVMGKVDVVREPAITGDFLRQTGNNSMAAAVDFIGTTARVPTRLLGAEDAFFKTIGYRAEVHAQALRLADSEGLKGPARWTRMMEIANDPPEYIRLAAADAAAYNTFTNATGVIGQKLGNLRDIPGVFFILPFVSTPVNIARYAFERSPIAPLVGQWRADLAAGGARADLAIARMGTGSAIMAMAMDMASNGRISGDGPDDPGEKANLLRQGWQPNSVFIGGKWYSYNRLDPLGMTIGFAANMAELVRRYDIEPEEVDEIEEQFAAGVALVSSVVINKTYMQGVSRAIEAMSQADDRQDKVMAFVNQLAASVVPAGANAIATGMDPNPPDINSAADAIMARIPELRSRLTKKRDLWGAEIAVDPGFGMFSPVVNAISPIAVSEARDSPIDAEMERLDMNINRIGKKVDFNGVAMNLRDYPKIYEQYVKLAGNELKHPAWGKGAKDLLDAIVEGRHELSDVYKMQADTRKPDEGGKAKFIANIITDFRKLARAAILADPDNAEFAALIGGQKERQREQRMPQLQ